jgi:hypothetical protein
LVGDRNSEGKKLGFRLEPSQPVLAFRPGSTIMDPDVATGLQAR